MPNLASAPSRAISSVGICPVLRKATESSPCLAWMALHPRDERVDRRVPVDRRETTVRAAQQRRGRAIRRAERDERLPSLRAGHAEVHRVVGRRRDVDGVAVAKVDVERAAGGAEAADQPRRGVGLEPAGDLPEPEAARLAFEIAREWAVHTAQQSGEAHVTPPGMPGDTEAAKKSVRSSSSPAKRSARLTTASATAPAGPVTFQSGKATPPAISAAKRAIA